MKLIYAALLASLIGCAAGRNMHSINQECQKKYNITPLAEGEASPKALASLHVRPVPNQYSAYACVVVTIDAAGVVTDARLAETDTPAYGEQVLNRIKNTLFQPATAGGKALPRTTVISVGYGQ